MNTLEVALLGCVYYYNLSGSWRSVMLKGERREQKRRRSWHKEHRANNFKSLRVLIDATSRRIQKKVKAIEARDARKEVLNS